MEVIGKVFMSDIKMCKIHFLLSVGGDVRKYIWKTRIFTIATCVPPQPHSRVE